MSLHHGGNLIRDGVILHLDAGIKKSYRGEGVWYDLSEYGNNGSLSGSYSYEDDHIMFNSGNETLIVANNAKFLEVLPMNSFTVTAVLRSTNWSRPRSRFPLYFSSYELRISNENSGITFGNGPNDSTRPSMLNIHVSDSVNSIFEGGAIAHNIIDDGDLVFWTLIINREISKIEVYINSQKQGDLDISYITGPIYSGKGMVFADSWGWKFIGGVYQFIIHDRALSEFEVSGLYHSFKSRYKINT